MSDVVPASFFPTPHEIAGGLRWMREHPVVATAAAAAATAVSVLTYLKSRVEEDAQQFATSRSSKSLQLGVPSSEQEPTWSDSDEELQTMATAADVTSKTRSSSDELLLLKSKQRRRGEMMKTNDEVYSATESEVSTTSPTVRRSHPSSLSVNNFAFSCAGDQEEGVGGGESDRHEGEGGEEERGIRSLAKDASAALRFGFPESVMEEDDDNSASPQWGWYVSTTPPDEYYT